MNIGEYSLSIPLENGNINNKILVYKKRISKFIRQIKNGNTSSRGRDRSVMFPAIVELIIESIRITV